MKVGNDAFKALADPTRREMLRQLATLLAYPQLPQSVATHWDANGVANGFSPRWSLFVFTPALMLGMMALFAALPWLSPRRFEVGASRRPPFTLWSSSSPSSR